MLVAMTIALMAPGGVEVGDAAPKFTLTADDGTE